MRRGWRAIGISLAFAFVATGFTIAMAATLTLLSSSDAPKNPVGVTPRAPEPSPAEEVDPVEVGTARSEAGDDEDDRNRVDSDKRKKQRRKGGDRDGVSGDQKGIKTAKGPDDEDPDDSADGRDSADAKAPSKSKDREPPEQDGEDDSNDEESEDTEESSGKGSSGEPDKEKQDDTDE